MRLETKKLLHDIKCAIDLLEEFTHGKSFVNYEEDAMLRSAVERQFEIIGEAMAQLSKIDERVAIRISNSRRIIAFRNRLIHGYSDVDIQLVWNVI